MRVSSEFGATYWATHTSRFLFCRPMITRYTLERGVGEARQKSNVWDDREDGCTAMLPLACEQKPSQRVHREPSRLQIFAVLQNYTNRFGVFASRSGPPWLCPTTEDCSLFISFKTRFQVCLICMCMQRGVVLLEESWEKRCKAPGEESEREAEYCAKKGLKGGMNEKTNE